MEKLLLIINPRAGKTKSQTPFYKAVLTFSQHGFLVHVHETSGRGDATRTIQEIGDQFDRIVCAGGDGTLNETIAGIMCLKKKPAVGYLPCGSTNDFAVSLGLSTDIERQAATIASGQVRSVDVGAFNNRYFSYVASFGAFTRSSYAAPQNMKNLLGHFAYILEGLTDLSSLHPYHLKITADGEMFDDSYLFGGICSSTSLGGVVRLDPDKVKMDDGLFEMILLRSPRNILEFNELVANLAAMHYDASDIVFRHVKEVSIETDDEVPWSLDGEYEPSSKFVHIENLKGALPLLR